MCVIVSPQWIESIFIFCWKWSDCDVILAFIHCCMCLSSSLEECYQPPEQREKTFSLHLPKVAIAPGTLWFRLSRIWWIEWILLLSRACFSHAVEFRCCCCLAAPALKCLVDPVAIPDAACATVAYWLILWISLPLSIPLGVKCAVETAVANL